MASVFETMVSRLSAEISSKGYAPVDTDFGANTAAFASEGELIIVEYSRSDKRFYLYRGAVDAASKNDCVKAQTYYFDESSDDSDREAVSVALDFADTLSGPAKATKARIASLAKEKKESSDDSMDVVFFINRIPSAFPECRLPLIAHKEHYEQVLPLRFCEETVCQALAENLRKGNKARLTAFFELLSNCYERGDMDTKSIITAVILNSITEPAYIELAESMISEALKKAWVPARRFIGKEVKPEPISTAKKLEAARATAERLGTTVKR